MGTTIAPLLAASFLLGSGTEDAGSVKTPFLVMALFVLCVAGGNILLHQTASHSGRRSQGRTLIGPSGETKIRGSGHSDIRAYVGAEVAIASGFLFYAKDYLGIESLKSSIVVNDWLRPLGELSAWLKGQSLASSGFFDTGRITCCIVLGAGAMIGRFLGSFLMARIEPTRLLTMAALGAILMIEFLFTF